MTAVLTIGWIFTILASISGYISGFYLLRSLSLIKKGEGIRSSFLFLTLASLIVITYSTIIAFFGLNGYEITNNLWAIVPLSFLITSFFYMVSTYTMFKSIRAVQEVEKKKK